MNKFEAKVDTILEDVALFDKATEQLGIVNQLTRDLKSAQKQLKVEAEILCSELAREVKRQGIGLTITNDRSGKLIIGYRNGWNGITLRPDIVNCQWVIDTPNKFERKFMRTHGQVLNLDVTEIAKAIASFFKQHYKSL